jgi:hypothetical protein
VTRIMLMITMSRKGFQTEITSRRRWAGKRFMRPLTAASKMICARATIGPSSENKGAIRIDLAGCASYLPVRRKFVRFPVSSFKNSEPIRMRLSGNRRRNPLAVARSPTA